MIDNVFPSSKKVLDAIFGFRVEIKKRNIHKWFREDPRDNPE